MPAHSTAATSAGLAIVVFGLASRRRRRRRRSTSCRAVTLAFEPYAPAMPEWIDARAPQPRDPAHRTDGAGDFPRQDPAPTSLSTSLDPRRTCGGSTGSERADRLCRRGQYHGRALTGSRTDLWPVLEELRNPGLMFVDGRPARRSASDALSGPMALPRVVSDRTLDAMPRASDRPAALRARGSARRRGAASVSAMFIRDRRARCIWRNLAQKGSRWRR